MGKLRGRERECFGRGARAPCHAGNGTMHVQFARRRLVLVESVLFRASFSRRRAASARPPSPREGRRSPFASRAHLGDRDLVRSASRPWFRGSSGSGRERSRCSDCFPSPCSRRSCSGRREALAGSPRGSALPSSVMRGFWITNDWRFLFRSFKRSVRADPIAPHSRSCIFWFVFIPAISASAFAVSSSSIAGGAGATSASGVGGGEAIRRRHDGGTKARRTLHASPEDERRPFLHGRQPARRRAG